MSDGWWDIGEGDKDIEPESSGAPPVPYETEFEIINEGKDPRMAVKELMTRDLKAED